MTLTPVPTTSAEADIMQAWFPVLDPLLKELGVPPNFRETIQDQPQEYFSWKRKQKHQHKPLWAFLRGDTHPPTWLYLRDGTNDQVELVYFVPKAERRFGDVYISKLIVQFELVTNQLPKIELYFWDGEAYTTVTLPYNSQQADGGDDSFLLTVLTSPGMSDTMRAFFHRLLHHNTQDVIRFALRDYPTQEKSA